MATPKTYLWNNNGTKQSDRLPKALSGDYVKIDERSFDDLLAQMAEYAKRLVYFDDNMNPSGDWTEFFKDVYDYDKHELKKERIEALSEAGDMPPHMALMMAFLKMFEVQQNNLNTLTERHLQFYYKDILGFKPRQGENGRATVFFEPVKNAPEAFIPKGTLFDAGKDANGKPITYRSVRDVTVNQMKVTETKRLPITGADKEGFGLIITHPVLPFLENEEKTLVSTYSDQLNITFEKDNIVITIKDSEDLSVLSDVLTESLSIKVTNSKNFVMENAQGALANQTGTMPFGPQPKDNDFFTIRVPHASGCTIDDVHHDDKWNNSPSITKAEGNSKLILEKGVDWSTYTTQLKNYIDYLKSSSPDAATMPEQPKAPSLAAPITIDYTISLKSSQKQYFSPFGTRVLNDQSVKSIQSEIKPMKDKQALCLKLEGIKEACVLTLHFEMNPFKYKIGGDYGTESPQWHYHTGVGWKTIADTDMISDTTNHFRHSGIVQLKLNEAVVSTINDIKGGLWLRIACNTTDDPFEALEAVRAQAVEVELDPQSEGQIEIGTALPMGSITKAKNSIKGIKKIEQPYSGEEGRKIETDASFYARVSEELRHKGRAWNRWDYERLVLERFPQIASAKCLSCCNKEGKMQAGCITMLVIPDGKAIHQPDPLKPIIGQSLKDEIISYLQKRVSSFVTIDVVTPTYVEAKVKCDFTLREGYTDINHYRNLLDEQLKAYLAPWSSGNEGMEFRTDKNESQVEEFIENQYYVDYIESFSLTIDGVPVKQGEPLQPEGAFIIVTSDKEHDINPNLASHE
jgi:hypothetical protein